jgi:CheY-like chemotaxis protein
VVGDAGRVRQILFNLIHNAIKFTEKGHVLLSIAPPFTDKGYLKFRIEVEDTGIGIPADKTHYIFHKFNQADSSTTRKFGGTGLGLSICRELCEMMGGSIGVNSELGKGSTFWCEVLLKEDVEKNYTISAPNHAMLNGLRVLIIDDNLTARTILREQLSPFGVQIKKALDYAEAEALIDAGSVFDVAIIDDALSDLWGADIGKRLKEKLPDIALFMLTSAPKRGDVKLLTKIGFAAYFARPIPNDQLRDALSLIAAARRIGKDLPIITQHNLRETKAVQQSDSAKSLNHKNAAILVVEDNNVNRLVAGSILKKYGFTPEFANDGKEAVKRFSEVKFDLIFMDCKMPEMDGYEATQTIRTLEAEQSLKHTPIVALTAHALKGDDEKCFAAGMDDYIAKPIRQQDLERVLVRWL